jgi:hypothetical protein
MNDPKLRWMDALFLKLMALGSPLVMPGETASGSPWYDNPKLLAKYHAHRKIRNRMAKLSRRANRT